MDRTSEVHALAHDTVSIIAAGVPAISARILE